MEWLLVSDPTQPGQSALPVIGWNGDDFTLTYLREGGTTLSGIRTTVQWATSLEGSWTNDGVTEEVIETYGASGRVRVRATIPAAGRPRMFVRFYAEL